MVPDPVTGRLKPYKGAAGIEITFHAPDQNAANRMATANGLPPAVLILPDELRGSSGGQPPPGPKATANRAYERRSRAVSVSGSSCRSLPGTSKRPQAAQLQGPEVPLSMSCRQRRKR